MRFRAKAMAGGQGVASYVLDAVDEADARRQLTGAGLACIALARERGIHLGARSAKLLLVTFSQELVALLEAGLSLVDSIETLGEKEASPAVRRTLDQVLVRLREGQGVLEGEHGLVLVLDVGGCFHRRDSTEHAAVAHEFPRSCILRQTRTPAESLRRGERDGYLPQVQAADQKERQPPQAGLGLVPQDVPEQARPHRQARLVEPHPSGRRGRHLRSLHPAAQRR